MQSPKTVKALETLGRVRLSESFFMRDFLHSEISQIEGVANIPEYPDRAIETGTQLCQQVLEPLQQALGRISIRSGYRSPAVNAIGAANKNQYNCSRNEATYARHIWDYPDASGVRGATACIVVNSFLDYYQTTGNWQALAWWIHDNIPGYCSLCFFPKLCAFNIRWSTAPQKTIKSYVSPRGLLTRPGMDNHHGSHEQVYRDFVKQRNLQLNL